MPSASQSGAPVLMTRLSSLSRSGETPRHDQRATNRPSRSIWAVMVYIILYYIIPTVCLDVSSLVASSYGVWLKISAASTPLKFLKLGVYCTYGKVTPPTSGATGHYDPPCFDRYV